MNRCVLIAAAFPAGLALSQFAASAPPGSFCARHPNNPKCRTTTTPTTATVPSTTTAPPPTTTAPAGTDRANLWVVP